MENRKFLSCMGLSLGIIMVISLIYFFTKPKIRSVDSYTLDNDTYFTGQMVKNKFEGDGEIKSNRGTYQGSFKNSRFDGPGTFKGDDFTYKADFSKDKGNKNIEIDLDTGQTYIKDGDAFKNKDMNDEN